jgi:hypothetical protein
VLLPSRPNRATGWIFTGGTGRSRLQIRRSSYLIRIQVGARKLSVDDGGGECGHVILAHTRNGQRIGEKSAATAG